MDAMQERIATFISMYFAMSLVTSVQKFYAAMFPQNGSMPLILRERKINSIQKLMIDNDMFDTSFNMIHNIMVFVKSLSYDKLSFIFLSHYFDKNLCNIQLEIFWFHFILWIYFLQRITKYYNISWLMNLFVLMMQKIR